MVRLVCLISYNLYASDWSIEGVINTHGSNILLAFNKPIILELNK